VNLEIKDFQNILKIVRNLNQSKFNYQKQEKIFENLKAMQKHPVIITADFESTLKKIEKKIGDKT
jgi:hypothetical protein